jgi:hypothetical protein
MTRTRSGAAGPPVRPSSTAATSPASNGGGGAPGPDDLESAGPPGGLLGQPGLADAGLAGDDQQHAPPGARSSQRRLDLGQDPGAGHERDRHCLITPC